MRNLFGNLNKLQQDLGSNIAKLAEGATTRKPKDSQQTGGATATHVHPHASPPPIVHTPAPSYSYTCPSCTCDQPACPTNPFPFCSRLWKVLLLLTRLPAHLPACLHAHLQPACLHACPPTCLPTCLPPTWAMLRRQQQQHIAGPGSVVQVRRPAGRTAAS